MTGKLENAASERIDEALEYFDDHWTPASRRRLRSLLERYALTDDPDAIAEFVRIDIERRYADGLSVRLHRYLAEFEILASRPERVAEVAFEDYRSRKVHGLPLTAARYAGLPGVVAQPWFQALGEDDLASAPSVSACLSQADGLADRERPVATEIADAELTEELRRHGFELIDRIGGGTFSQVYLATQIELSDRFVVLKVVRRSLTEPQKLALLQHTNIVPIYSFHELAGRSVICMPYAGSVTLESFQGTQRESGSRSGETLIATVHRQVDRTWTDQSGPGAVEVADGPAADEAAVLGLLERLRHLDGPRLAVWLFGRLAAGLAHSHARGVLHGDLKPANVLIRNDGEPALLDFNLSRDLMRPTDRRIGGTLPYMSPEGFRELIAAESKPDPSSDIYSLGVMLFEFVTGRLPYPAPRSAAATDLEMAIEQRKRAPEWRREDAAGPGLRSIIDHCLRFEPSGRYRSAEQLQQDLACQEEHRPLRFAPESFRSRARKWAVRHPRATSTGPIALACLLLLVPAVFSATTWRGRLLSLAASARLDQFRGDSERALAALIVDPLRASDKAISEALRPLRVSGIWDPGSAAAFLSDPHLGDEDRERARDLMYRHVGHVAWVEVDRLESRLEGPATDADLRRLDDLLAILATSAPSAESRPPAMLAAARARVAGDEAAAAEWSERAIAAEAECDTGRYLEAVRLQTERSFASAIEILASLADRESIPSAIRWTMLGRTQLAAHDYEAAKMSFTQSLERSPGSARLWLLRAHCHRSLRQIDRAEQDYSEALGREPGLTAAWVSRAQIRNSAGRPEEALADLDEGLRHRPGDAALLMFRSDLLRRLDRHAASERDFELAARQTDLNSRQLLARGLYRRQQDPEGALADFEAALRTQRKNPRLHALLATEYDRRDRPEDAIVALEMVERLEPENERPTIDRAVLLARLGRREQALQAYELALRPPSQPRTLYQAACVNSLLGGQVRLQTALIQLAKAVRGGFDPSKMLDDPDLAAVREMPRFRAFREMQQLVSGGRPQLKSIEIDPPDDWESGVTELTFPE